MRLPLYSLYFTIALSVVVCCLSSAEAKKKTPPSRWPVPVQCFTNTQSVFRGQTIAANYICIPFEGGCTCTVTFCPALCGLQLNWSQCTSVRNCVNTFTKAPLQCSPISTAGGTYFFLTADCN
jgi:hypothetical protein